MAATFSICIPLYNGGATIERALTSLVEQTDADWSCVVVDDASTDDSLVRARRVDDARIQLEACDENVGMTANWNRALQWADGTYTILLGHDDALAPDALATLRRELLAHPDAAMVGFGARVHRHDGPDLHIARRHLGDISPGDLRAFALWTSDTPAPSQVAYRTDVLAGLLPLDLGFRYCPEIDLQFRIGAAGHGARYLAECIGVRGNDEDRVSGQVRATPIPLRDHYRLLVKHEDAEPRLAARQYQRLRRRGTLSALRALRAGRPRVALSFARTVIAHELRRYRSRRGQMSSSV